MRCSPGLRSARHLGGPPIRPPPPPLLIGPSAGCAGRSGLSELDGSLGATARRVPAVDAAEVPGAVAACRAVAVAGGLRVDDAVVLNDSNRLAVHLTGCDVLARVTPLARRDAAQLEVDVARLLVETDAPVGLLDPRIEPRVHEPRRLRRHAVDLPRTRAAARHRARRVRRRPRADARRAAAGGPDRRTGCPTSPIGSTRRSAWSTTPPSNPAIGRRRPRAASPGRCAPCRRAIADRGAPEQLLHGEPHPGNVLRTRDGLVFVDLETCCRRARRARHRPRDHRRRSARRWRSPPTTPGPTPPSSATCWILSLALATAWRCQPGDDLPNGAALARDWIRQLRAALDP